MLLPCVPGEINAFCRAICEKANDFKGVDFSPLRSSRKTQRSRPSEAKPPIRPAGRELLVTLNRQRTNNGYCAAC